MSKVEKIKAKIEKDHEAFYDSVIGLSTEDLRKNILLYTKYLQETIVVLKTKKEIKDAEARLREAKKPFQTKIKDYKEKIAQLKSFVDKSICVDDLENQMVYYAMAAEEQKFRMENCPHVQAAKDDLQEVKGPLTDAKKVLELKISFLNILIGEQEGYEPGYREDEE